MKPDETIRAKNFFIVPFIVLAIVPLRPSYADDAAPNVDGYVKKLSERYRPTIQRLTEEANNQRDPKAKRAMQQHLLDVRNKKSIEAPSLKYPPDLGDIGKLPFMEGDCIVAELIGPSKMVVDGATSAWAESRSVSMESYLAGANSSPLHETRNAVIIDDCPTKGYVTKSPPKGLPAIFYVARTESIHGKTVFVLKPFDSKEADEKFRKQKN